MAEMTKLSPAEEQKFQEWIRETEWYKEFVRDYGEEPDLNTKDYDYRKAWKAGIVPQRDPYDNNRFHWDSTTPTGEMLKSEDHPTAWKQYFLEETGKNPDEIGIKSKEQAEKVLKKRLDKRPLLKDTKLENE